MRLFIFTLLFYIPLFLSPCFLYADIYVGEVQKEDCKIIKGKDFKKYLTSALSDSSLDTTYEKSGLCGEALYVTKKKTRKRIRIFPELTGCQCYLNTLQSLSKEKDNSLNKGKNLENKGN